MNTPDEIKQYLIKKGLPAYRFLQIRQAFFKNSIISFDKMTFLPQELQKELQNAFQILPFTAIKVLASDNGRSLKAVLKLTDNYIIETALLNTSKNFWSACVSSQVGCAMKCVFCATGTLGCRRNLTAEEIWGQVLFWKNYMQTNKIGKGLTNIVFMGMGEPFNNFKNVCDSISVLIDKEMFNIGQRSISLSTCGVLANITAFAEKFPQINLAISLHSADNEIRNKLMPSNKLFNLQFISHGLKKYFKKSNRKVFIEYIMLDGVNDNLGEAKKLANYLNALNHRQLLHVNLISFNPVKNIDLKPSSKNQIAKFKEILLKEGFDTTIRKSLGQEIEAACGQLAVDAKTIRT